MACVRYDVGNGSWDLDKGTTMRRRSRKKSVQTESLEVRALLCVTASLGASGTLVVEGTAESEAIAVFNTGETIVAQCEETRAEFDPASIERIHLFGLGGDDQLDFSEVGDIPGRAYGGPGNDELTGQGFDIYGGGDNDRIALVGPAGIVHGGAGNDSIQGSEAGEVLVGGSGDDTIDGASGDDTLEGEAGDDYLIGGAGRDLGNGGSGSDSIVGGAGQDTLNGYGESGSSDTDIDTLSGGASLDVLNLQSAAGGLALGGDGADVINGSDGPDSLDGGDGNDTIIGNAGNDDISGGADQDSVVGGAGDDTVRGGGGNDFVNGGGDNDSLTGGSGDDVLVGARGDDFLDGGNNHDLVVGGEGADVVRGGSGEDIVLPGNFQGISGASAINVLVEWTSDRTFEERVANLTDGSGSLDRANLSTFIVAGDTALDDTDSDTLEGGTGRDWFFANPDDDSLLDFETDEVLDSLRS